MSNKFLVKYLLKGGARYIISNLSGSLNWPLSSYASFTKRNTDNFETASLKKNINEI